MSNATGSRAPARADALADITLTDHTGEPVRLGDQWAERPAALVFLRHYGWVFCREHAMQLHRDRDRFEAAGVNLVLVGHGTPAQAAHFREQYGVELPLLVDSDRRAYAAAGAGMASRGQLYGPGVVMRGFYRGVKAGIVQGRTQGDAAQLGGVLVVATDGTVVWSHLSEDASDNPPNDEVLKGVEAAVARS